MSECADSGSGHPTECDCAVHASEVSVSLGGSPRQVVFQIRERSAMIKYFGDTAVTVRGGLFCEGNVIAVAVLLRVGRYVTKEYTTWWDYQRPQCRPLFEAMSGEGYLSFHFCGEHGRIERTFIAANTLRHIFADAIGRIGALAPWSPQEFGSVRLKILSGLPPGQSLWDTVAANEGARREAHPSGRAQG